MRNRVQRNKVRRRLKLEKQIVVNVRKVMLSQTKDPSNLVSKFHQGSLTRKRSRTDVDQNWS